MITAIKNLFYGLLGAIQKASYIYSRWMIVIFRGWVIGADLAKPQRSVAILQKLCDRVENPVMPYIIGMLHSIGWLCIMAWDL